MNIKPIRNDQDYKEALVMLEALVQKDPVPESEDGDKLSILSTLVEDYESTRYPQSFPTPLEAIEFRMEQANLQPTDLVPYIGSRSKVSEVLSGKRSLSLEMIRALESGLGIPASALIQKADARKGQFHTWTDAIVKVMEKRGYFDGATFDGKNKESLLTTFFNNQTPMTSQLAWRKTARLSIRTDQYALLAWVEYLEKKASTVRVPTEYKDGLITQTFLQQIIKFSPLDNGPLLAQEFLMENGIVLVVADHLPKTRVDGVAILKNKSRPIIGLSLRFDRLDNFWFTLLHELAHVALHLDRDDGGVIFDELEDGLGIVIDEDEVAADNFAQEAIVPASKWAISPAKITPSVMAVEDLAEELGISSAVVAGYVRHQKQNYYYLRKLINNEENKVRHLFQAQLTYEKM